MLVWLTLAVAIGTLAAQTAGPTNQAAARAITTLDLQTELPQKAAQDAINKLDLQTELPREHLELPKPWNFSFPPFLGWIVAIIAVALLLYAFRDLVPAWRTDAAAIHEEAGAEEAVPSMPAMVLETADQLAARGRFVEAMHVLLLHGLAHIRARLDLQFSDSLTSREILVNRNLPDAARRSLRDVVARVELTYFGLRPAGATDYAACRASFAALEQALYAGATA